MLLHEKIEKILTQLEKQNITIEEAKDSIIQAILFSYIKRQINKENKQNEINA